MKNNWPTIQLQQAINDFDVAMLSIYGVIFSEKITDLLQNTQEFRLKSSQQLRVKYPEKVPVIVLYSRDFTDFLPNSRILFPVSYRIYDFQIIIRRKLKLSQSDALFTYCCKVDGHIKDIDEPQLQLTNKRLQKHDTLLSNLYSGNASNDGFLYLIISREQVFG